MSLLDRARERLRERHVQNDDLTEMHHSRDRRGALGVAVRALELEAGQLTSADLTLADPGSAGWEDNLWQFDLEGHHFVVGTYWHGNPGRGSVLAVRVAAVRGKPEWPPPHPRSVSNTRWAPAGYHAIYSLADLAEALDGAKG